MCGIALIIAGLRINLSSTLFPTSSTTSTPDFKQGHFPILHIDDLKAALRRRGPDHLGCKKVYLQLKTSDQPEDEDEVPLFNVEEATKRMMSCFSETKKVSIISVAEVVRNNDFFLTKSLVELQFVGATLQLRGTTPIRQPLMDTSGNILVYNGEIFGGLHIDNNSNDAETLRGALGRCCTCNCHGPERASRCIEKGKTSAVKLLSTLKGPWALIYWQDSSKILWFGRDAFGRRSLLVHWPTLDDSRFLLSSVSPSATVKGTVDSEAEDQMGDLDFWEELPCGIYSLNLETSEDNGHLVGEVRKHEWEDVVLNELIKWDRNCIEPNAYKTYSDNVTSGVRQSRVHSTDANGIASKLGVKEGCIVDHIDVHVNLPASIPNNDFHSDAIHPSLSLPADKVLTALRDSVMRRTILDPVYLEAVAEAKQKKHVPLAIMFSGGLDSMILAALSDRCLDSCYDIDLLNVSFDGQLAPDRISAREGLQELKRIAPSRRWNLVEIDADLSTLTSETKHVMSLINPSKTYMDLNIGIALWLAAGGDGRISEGSADDHEQYHKQFKYKSNAKILLVGSGADEQCAGYSRHKTKYRLGGWLGLYEEMKLDMQRIWKRNLGRDDRCISDTGKEARFPFLDEDVIKTLLEIPLWEIANLDQPVGRGDKKILREVAQLLGLEAAAFLPKRAIQFGSRIARESNRKNFGSNRAANQASAGSVVINMPTTLNDRSVR